jgi:hypothetical protein
VTGEEEEEVPLSLLLRLVLLRMLLLGAVVMAVDLPTVLAMVAPPALLSAGPGTGW